MKEHILTGTSIAGAVGGYVLQALPYLQFLSLTIGIISGAIYLYIQIRNLKRGA